jgi:hypothetical protein
MLLDTVADRTSDLVWRLDREKILTATEDGLAVEAIQNFLEEHSSEPLPQTVGTLLRDLLDHATLLRDMGTVRMLECRDAETARLLRVHYDLPSVPSLSPEDQEWAFEHWSAYRRAHPELLPDENGR